MNGLRRIFSAVTGSFSVGIAADLMAEYMKIISELP
jgi:uncharacterized membrane protein YjjB (DUF3815 family)